MVPVNAADRFEETLFRFQDGLLGLVAALRGQRGVDAELGGEPGVVFARDAGIGGGGEAADRGCGDRDRLGHGGGVQMEQAGCSHRGGKYRAVAAMEPPARENPG